MPVRNLYDPYYGKRKDKEWLMEHEEYLVKSRIARIKETTEKLKKELKENLKEKRERKIKEKIEKLTKELEKIYEKRPYLKQQKQIPYCTISPEVFMKREEIRDVKSMINNEKAEIRRYQERIETINRNHEKDSQIELNEMKEWLKDKYVFSSEIEELMFWDDWKDNFSKFKLSSDREAFEFWKLLSENPKINPFLKVLPYTDFFSKKSILKIFYTKQAFIKDYEKDINWAREYIEKYKKKIRNLRRQLIEILKTKRRSE